MDYLRKRVEDFRLKVRRFVNRQWHNDPEGDTFRSLDVLLVLGVVRYTPTQRWQRICWNTSRAVSAFCVPILAFNLMDQLSDGLDLVKVTWHATATSTGALCLVKAAILDRHFESIQTVRSFINGKPFRSEDAQRDSACRKKFFQRLQATVLVVLIIVLTNHVIFNVPNSGIDELFGTPRILHLLGPNLASGVHSLFIFTLCPIWFNKYVIGTATICSLLYGLKIEHEIFARGFANLLDQVHSDVEEKPASDDPEATPEWKCLQKDKLFWECLERRLNAQVKLHVQLVEHMQLLQPVVKILFGILYYHAMVLFSPLIYVVLFKGLSSLSFFLVSGIVLNLLECYGWCSFVESHQDINDTLELEIMDLMTKIPHSQVHHEKYVEVRATLCIMKTFVRNNQQFSCAGVFPITVEIFTDLLYIGYKVVTFLRDVGTKG